MKKNPCTAVVGIGVTPFEDLPVNPTVFTEVSIPETVTIPMHKPEAEDLFSVAVDIEVLSMRLIKTAVGTSNELQTLTGYKLILELKLRQKVKYVADEPKQHVHAAHFEKVVSSVFVVVPPAMPAGNPPVLVSIETLFNQGRLVVKPYIEDIYAKLIGKRTIFKNITVLVNVTAV